VHAALGRQLGGILGFYEDLAAEVARPPSRHAPMPDPVELSAALPVSAALSPRRVRGASRADALWVGQHLDQLEEHAADVAGPAERLAIVRRTPWWR
jgi:hypothetical protein